MALKINLYKHIDKSLYEPFILLNQRGDHYSNIFRGLNVFYIGHQTLDIKPDSKIFYKYNNLNNHSFFRSVRISLGLIYRIIRDVIL